ncbi:MAG TPA: tetratricopeptide repeat protein [Streptosporangiaceae bacterium]
MQSPENEPGSHTNRADAERVKGNIVQARDVGGINIYGSRSAAQELAVPRQLPGDVSNFVDRGPELTALAELLASAGEQGSNSAKVIVISGSAGVGKTALALRWAHSVRSRFPAGELYVNLRGYDDGPPQDPSVVLDRMLRALGVPGSAISSDTEDRSAALRSLLADRDILLFLDNAVSSNQVRPLLPGSARPLVIVTSRSTLPALAARDGARRIRLDILEENDALDLLRTVSQGTRKDSDAELRELASLCARLPLALRIAGERAASRPMMRLTELIEDLRDDSLLWEALSLDDDSSSDAVRTVFAWSYRALSADVARIFRLLGVNPGDDIGLSGTAALAGAPVRTARRALDLLVGAFMAESSAPGRFRLHDLLKAYALAEARAAHAPDELRRAVRRLSAWYAATVSESAKLLTPGDAAPMPVDEPGIPAPLSFADSVVALDWFELERPNVVATARAALEEELFDSAWLLALAARPILMHHFVFDDWDVLSGVAVTAARALRDPARLATALQNRGNYLFRRRRLDEAREILEEALRVRENIGEEHAVCESLNALGLVRLWSRELDQAAELFRRAAAGFRDVGDQRWESLALSNVAETYLEGGDAERALELVGQLPTVFERLGDVAMQGNALWLIAWGERLRGDLATASAGIHSALTLAEAASNRMWEAFWLIEAARIHLAEGAFDEAMNCCSMAASLQRQIGDTGREALALGCAGEVLQALGNLDDAASFHRQALRMHEAVGNVWQSALALANLADCENSRGDSVSSQALSVRALELIEPFHDGPAETLRERLIRLADGRHTNS